MEAGDCAASLLSGTADPPAFGKSEAVRVDQ